MTPPPDTGAVEIRTRSCTNDRATTTGAIGRVVGSHRDNDSCVVDIAHVGIVDDYPPGDSSGSRRMRFDRTHRRVEATCASPRREVPRTS